MLLLLAYPFGSGALEVCCCCSIVIPGALPAKDMSVYGDRASVRHRFISLRSESGVTSRSIHAGSLLLQQAERESHWRGEPLLVDSLRTGIACASLSPRCTISSHHLGLHLLSPSISAPFHLTIHLCTIPSYHPSLHHSILPSISAPPLPPDASGLRTVPPCLHMNRRVLVPPGSSRCRCCGRWPTAFSCLWS